MLPTLTALLVATVVAVPLTRAAGFGSVLGYLLAGIVIGPEILGLVGDVEQIRETSELGVVMLLFLVGLDVQPHRLWVLRRAVFGLGLGQVVPSAALVAGAAITFGLPWQQGVVLGLGLAFSSTAIVLPLLTERGLLGGTAGRDAFAVLLFQDMAFIPAVALLPLLATGGGTMHVQPADVLKAVLAIGVILVAGNRLVPRVFRLVGGTRTQEVFTATALLLVVGAALLAQWAGLSTSLGAFLAGVVLSESEYRHELEADIEPFEGLLLGFFFISVGMSADLKLAAAQPLLVLAATLGVMVAKFLVTLALGWWRRRSWEHAVRFALSLPQGSEFSFVLFGAGVAAGVLAPAQASLATLVVAASMLLSPVLFGLSERFLIPRLPRRRAPAFDTISQAPAAVVIAGFGRVGQIVGRILSAQRIEFVALDRDPSQVEVVRRFGGRVYFGDPSRLDVLRAAGLAHAKILVIAIDDMEQAVRIAELAKRAFPRLTIHARARNRRHAHAFMDVGVSSVVRETYFSSIRLAENVLGGLGLTEADARRVAHIFRERDERALLETHAYAHDESALMQNSRDIAQELEQILAADRATKATT